MDRQQEIDDQEEEIAHPPVQRRLQPCSSNSFSARNKVLFTLLVLVFVVVTSNIFIFPISPSWISDPITLQSNIQKNGGSAGKTKCLRILAIGTSVTMGSAGFHGAHPDAPDCGRIPDLPCKDAWPTVLENLLNNNFPCSAGSNFSDSIHRVVNKAGPGCHAQCHLQKWPENYADYSKSKWDLIIIEPTATGSTGDKILGELNDIQALVAALSTSPSSSQASFILLSASFRKIRGKITTYEEIPDIEHGVSDLARQWRIPFVSFPEYLFSNGLYNSSNHQRHCLEARCTYWVDWVHVTKTSHTIIAKLVLNAIIANSSSTLDNLGIDKTIYNATSTTIALPKRPNITIDALSLAVKNLLPEMPKIWISFRTEELPSLDNNLICLRGFHPHNSRERLSTMYDYESTPSDAGELQLRHNATIALKIPMKCEAPSIQIEFLNSYTTKGVLQLMSSNGTGISSCKEVDFTRDWKFVGSFNSSNDEEVSVSKTMKFQIDRNESFVKGIIFGGDFHLLSIGMYCSEKS